MNLVYAKNDYLEGENKRFGDKIKSVLSICSTLNIYCDKEHSVWGIWLKLDEKTYLVDMLELVNSIYLDDEYYMLNEYPSQEGSCRTIVVQKNCYCYSWIITGNENQKTVRLCFNLHEYTSKIKTCLEKLYEKWSNGNLVAYKPTDFKIDDVKMALKQLNNNFTIPTYYRRLTKDINVEPFVFEPLADKWCEQYRIAIGNRGFDSWLTHWDNNFNKIRYQFERFYYERDAEIKLSFDMSNTVLKITEISVLDEVNESEEFDKSILDFSFSIMQFV